MIMVPIDIVLALAIWTVLTFLSTSRIGMPRIGVASVGSLYLVANLLSRPPRNAGNDGFPDIWQRRNNAHWAQAEWINSANRVPSDIGIRIDAAAQSDRITLAVAPRRRIIAVPEVVVMQSRLNIIVLPLETQVVLEHAKS